MTNAEILDEQIEILAKENALDSLVEQSDSLLASLKHLKTQIAKDQSYDVSQIETQFEGWHQNNIRQEKKMHKALRNYTANTDNMFHFDLDSVCRYGKVGTAGDPHTEQLIYRAIVMDLLRKGEFDVAQVLCDQSGLELPKDLVDNFKELYNITESITKSGDLAPAIEWARSHSAQLKEMGSDLEFQLHRSQFLSISKKEDTPFDAYLYAKHEFGPFVSNHLDTISGLFGKFAFKGLPLGDSIKEKEPEEEQAPSKESLCATILHDYCALMNVSAQSPLFNALLTGYLALPSFKKFRRISRLSNNLNWTTSNELPFEINLPKSLQFHSIFICPVSKEETTDDNLPMVLPCRHLISNRSLRKLSKSGFTGFKCPYCPRTCTISQAKEVKFINIS